jgi:hypothetical protein
MKIAWIHRISGRIICLLFLMWFVTGLVLIYHAFPNVKDAQRNEKKEPLSAAAEWPDIQTLLSRIPEPDAAISGIRLYRFQGQTLFDVKTQKGAYTLCADMSQTPLPVTWETVRRTARQWVDAPAFRVDTLQERDQWIMYSSYLRKMPVYKFYYQDEERHQLYIAARTGEVLQFTTKSERFWAWVGAIPHKFYFPFIRKDADRWILLITLGGIVGCIAAVSGLCTGLSVVRRRYKATHRIECPYRKRRYRWHHITGLIFGLFLITWAFSGAMSMQKIPQWVVKTYGNYRISPEELRGPLPTAEEYVMDYRAVRKAYPEVKEIEWSNFGRTPVYNLIIGNRTLSLDASTVAGNELSLSESQVEEAIRNVHGDEAELRITPIRAYDEYYLTRKGDLPLPVYKVEIKNVDKSRYYVNPKTGDFKYINRSRMVKKWVFSGLHYFQIKWLVDRPILWTLTIWIVSIGGAIVCLTGTIISIKN